jgi:hypothetical protein
MTGFRLIALASLPWMLCFPHGLTHAVTAEPAARLRVEPASLHIHGKGQSQSLLPYLENTNTAVGIPNPVAFETLDPHIVEVSASGQVRAIADGNTRVRVRAGEQSIDIPVQISGTAELPEWNFHRHVLPVLSKAGCNSGGCHGALAGKGGFRLSLAGYDPIADHFAITRDAGGRRVEQNDPLRSLLLTKASVATPHKGGKRLDYRTEDYRLLAEWIASGAPAGTAEDAPIEKLEITPAQWLLPKGQKARFIVRARYANGITEDVTRWVKFTSTDETVVKLTATNGEIEVVGPGEGALSAWFSSRIVLARVSSPFSESKPSLPAPPAAKPANPVDAAILQQTALLGLECSPRTDDATFLRRVYLDVIGLPPTADEARSFLADASPDKRTTLIDRLLNREEYVDYWTNRWADLLLISGRHLRPEAVKAYHTWLRREIKQGTPWDQLARQIVTARGGSIEQGATNFFAVHQDPESMAENVSQAFMGLSINCAKCHNHPLEKWTNDQYYAFANLFARVRAKGWGGDVRNGDGKRTLFLASSGELIQPRSNRHLPPAPLDATPIAENDPRDRREVLADWLVSPNNPYFTRAIVNRVWAAFFGIGIINPVDDLRLSNPASNEALMNHLTQFLIAHHYDLKALMRLILQSDAYQRSTETNPTNEGDTRFFSHQLARRLSAEALIDAISAVTGVPDEFNAIVQQDGATEKTELFPKGTRAMQVFDAAIKSNFLKTFGRNQREITCECERSNQPSLVQALHLSNGDTINQKLAAKDGTVTRWLESTPSPTDLVESAFLTCLSRPPSPREMQGYLDIFNAADPKEKRAVLEDLLWSLLTCREFLFQH